MDEPATSRSSGPELTRARSSRARTSGAVLIGDVPIRLGAASEEHGTALASYTAAWTRSDREPTLRLVHGAAEVRLPDREHDREAQGVRLWWDDDHIWASDELGLAGVAEREVVRISGPSDRRKSLDRVAPFLLSWPLARVDRYLLHAAALLAPSGGAVLALGGTGVGKSSLVGVALASGWRALSDDLVVVRHGEDRVEVCGVRRLVALPPEVAALVGGDLPPLANDALRSRHALPAERLTEGFHPIRAVVVVGHNTEPTSCLRPIDGRTAFDALRRGRVLASTPRIVRGWMPTAATLSRLPSFDLLHGADPGARPVSSQKRVEELAAELR